MAIGTLGYNSVQILAIGTLVEIRHKSYEVLSTTTKSDEKGQYTTFADLLPIDDEGEQTGEDTITVNLDTVDVTV